MQDPPCQNTIETQQGAIQTYCSLVTSVNALHFAWGSDLEGLGYLEGGANPCIPDSSPEQTFAKAAQTCSALINFRGVMAKGRQMTSSGHAIKNANVSIQCEFYANGKVKSKIRAALG